MDESLHSLSELPRLTCLNISGTAIPDGGVLRWVPAMRSLRKLYRLGGGEKSERIGPVGGPSAGWPRVIAHPGLPQVSSRVSVPSKRMLVRKRRWTGKSVSERRTGKSRNSSTRRHGSSPSTSNPRRSTLVLDGFNHQISGPRFPGTIDLPQLTRKSRREPTRLGEVPAIRAALAPAAADSLAFRVPCAKQRRYLRNRMRYFARTGLWEALVSNHPGPPGLTFPLTFPQTNYASVG